MGKIKTFIFGGECTTQDKEKQNKELENCTFVKTCLMLIVVLYHSILFWRGNWISIPATFDADVLGEMAKWMNTYHVQTFTFVSGYIFYSLKYEYGKYTELKPFIKNKIQRLIVPYVFVSLSWVIPFSILGGSDAVDIVHQYLLGEGPSQLWFLLMLFWVFVIFGVLTDFFKKHDIIGAMAVLIIYELSFEIGDVLPNIYQIFKACRFVIFFWLGFKFRQYPKNIFKKIPAWFWVVCSIAIYVLSIFLPSTRFIFRKIKKILPLAVSVTGVISTFTVLQRVANKINFNNKLFALLKNHSMQIYFYHQQIIYVCIYFLNGHVNPYINATINFLVSISFSLIISLLLHKFKTTSFLIGEK